MTDKELQKKVILDQFEEVTKAWAYSQEKKTGIPYTTLMSWISNEYKEKRNEQWRTSHANKKTGADFWEVNNGK
jgi:hypothetical protein